MADTIVFAPLSAVPAYADIDGALYLRGDMFGTTPLGAVIDGSLLLAGSASMSLSTSVVVSLPSRFSGSLTLGGGMVGSARAFGEFEGALRVGGEALVVHEAVESGAATALVDGALVLDGEMLAPSDIGTYGLLVTQEYVMSSYAGLMWDRTIDQLSFGGDAYGLQAALLREIFTINTARRALANTKTKTVERFSFGDKLAAVYIELLEEGVVFSSTVTADYQMISRVVDRLLINGVARDYADAVSSVVDAMSFGVLAELFAYEKVTDSVALASTVDELYTAVERFVDSLLLSPTATATFNMAVTAGDVVALGGGAFSNAELYQLIREGVGFVVSFSADSQEYVAWTINTKSEGLSRYTNYPFNSFAKVGGRYLGASSAGVFDLSGDDDDGVPINAKIRLGMWDLGTRLFKRFPECYIGFAGNGDLLLRTITPDAVTGENVAAVYRVHRRLAANVRESKFALGRGLKSVDWDFELENINGADFELAAIEFIPLRTNRRTRG